MAKNSAAFYDGFMKTLLVTSVDPKLSDSDASLMIVKSESSAFVPSLDPLLLDPVEDIQVRAETMTSLLQGIMDYRPPMHWGINE
jgi:hypothetical protein